MTLQPDQSMRSMGRTVRQRLVRLLQWRCTTSWRTPAVWVWLLALGVMAHAAGADEIYLINGDRLTGQITKETTDHVVLEHGVLGSVKVTVDQIDHLVRAGAVAEPAAKTMDASPGTPWTREMTLGYDLNRGNTEAEGLSGGFSASRKTTHDEWTLQASGEYGTSKRRMDVQRYGASARYASSFGSRLVWYQFYKVDAGHDRFANIEWRAVPSAGLGYWFADRADWKAMTEVGLGWERTSFRDATANRSEVVLVPRGFAEKTFRGETTLSQDVTVWPVMSDRGKYRLRAETVLTNPITAGLSLRVNFIDDYQSDPGSGTKKNDARILSSLVYAF